MLNQQNLKIKCKNAALKFVSTLQKACFRSGSGGDRTQSVIATAQNQIFEAAFSIVRVDQFSERINAAIPSFVP